jgi:hypothetical protein
MGGLRSNAVFIINILENECIWVAMIKQHFIEISFLGGERLQKRGIETKSSVAFQ